MKKIILSLIVILSFLFYSLHERSDGQDAQIIAPRQSSPDTSSSDQPTLSTPPPATTQTWKDGVYTGKSADAFYGTVQVRATITSGKLTDVEILDYPSERRTSEVINGRALPLLQQEAIINQHANVDLVSGATDTSIAFRESLASALNQAN